MANMNYCRFDNTLADLRDCYEHMDDNDLSKDEQQARQELIRLCVNLGGDYEEDLLP